ncbi:UBX domain protein Ubx2 [Coemansia sp. RSA 1365]|nr:UBX domain protein Ubx2 [Coemansia sp. RSA 1365]
MSENNKTRTSPTDFLNIIIGKRVFVRLNSGIDYKGVLSCLDGYMNIALEMTEEYVDGELRNRYGDAFIRGNNVLYIIGSKKPMDYEQVQNFCAVTGAEPNVATGYLQVAESNVEQAISLYFENGGQPLHAHEEPAAAVTGAASTGVGLDADGTRAPIPARSAVLADGYGNDMGSAYHHTSYEGNHQHSLRRVAAATTASSIFNQNTAAGRVPFRDFAQEAAEMAGGGAATDETSGNFSRRSRLAELFKPPFDIMHQGNLDSARQKAMREGKWVLVNLQEVSEFRCQALNRDIWSQNIVKEIIGKEFIFLQIATDTPEGRRVATMYNATTFPFIAVIHPKTGEKRTSFTRFKNVPDIIEDITTFTFDNALPKKAGASSRSGNESASSSRPGETTSYGNSRVGHMSEAEMMEAAIAASRTGNIQQPLIVDDSDSEPSLGYGDDTSSYSEIESISSEEDGDEDEVVKMDVDDTSSGHAQTTTLLPAESQRMPTETINTAENSPDAWYKELPLSEPAQPNSGPTATQIKFRFPGGNSVVRRFAKTDKVIVIFQYLKATRPEATSQAPEVQFMHKRLADCLSQTIEAAKLVNASLFVEV